MATHTRAELPVIFDCNVGEDGLGEFDPEPQRGPSWLRDNAAVVGVQRWEPYIAPPRPRQWPLVLPVLVAGLIAGGAASWFGLSAGSASLPSAPRPAVSNEARDVSSDVPGDVLVAPPARASLPEPTSTTAPAEPVTARIDPAFDRTLARVSQAYRARDAQSLAAVWPGADIAALSRAFSGLKYQALSFDHCAVRPGGASSAVATCDVVIATAPKAGDPALERRHESWSLLLERSGELWTISGVSVR